MTVEHEQIELLRGNPQLLAEVEGAFPPAQKPPQYAPAAATTEGIDGAALLREIESFIGKYVILPAGALLPVALWAVATHTYESFDTFPYLALLSPVKRCGKTRTIEVLSLITAKARQTVNISEAALFRLIEATSPTLMLDEAEALAGKTDRAEAIRALLNAGNRKGMTVPRCVGKNYEVREFRVYGPKVVAGIGQCSETVKDRSILINMQRRRPSDKIERFLYRTVKPIGVALQAKIAGAVQHLKGEIEQAHTMIDLPFLGDRDAEAWEPLFAVLTVADPARLGELRNCAVRLSQGKTAADEDDSVGLRLLADIRAVWPDGNIAMTTTELLSRLAVLEESPWREEIPLNPRKLSRMLRGFDVAPRTVRAGGGISKGYVQAEVESALSRYLSVLSVTCVTSAENIG